MKKTILISTGGSGGHVIPATIFFEHLKYDYEIIFSTDIRGLKFLDNNKYNVEIINTPKLFSNFFLLPFKLILIFLLTIKSTYFLKRKKIKFIISTGGYMSLPLCLAAKILNKKIYLFEPNMVLGKANKFFLSLSEKIFCYSSDIKNFPLEYVGKISLIKPLLRKTFYELEVGKDKRVDNILNLLIIGGSQGAKLFDTIIKETIITLSKKYKLTIFQQTKKSNIEALKNFYEVNNIKNELFDYDDNILELFKKVNFSITRGGASTLSELIFLNIPHLVIPLPIPNDDHQYQNALFYKNNDCCWILNQEEISESLLTNNLINILEDKNDYIKKVENMKKFNYQNTWNNINQKIKDTLNENRTS